MPVESKKRSPFQLILTAAYLCSAGILAFGYYDAAWMVENIVREPPSSYDRLLYVSLFIARDDIDTALAGIVYLVCGISVAAISPVRIGGSRKYVIILLLSIALHIVLNLGSSIIVSLRFSDIVESAVRGKVPAFAPQTLEVPKGSGPGLGTYALTHCIHVATVFWLLFHTYALRSRGALRERSTVAG